MKLYIDQTTGGEWDVMNRTGRTEQQFAIQSGMSTLLRKRGDKKNF
jgi:hypothetical protein